MAGFRAFSRNYPDWKSLCRNAMIPYEVERASAANVGLQPAVAMMPVRDNDTSVTHGPATMKAGRLNSYEAVSLAAPEEIPHFRGVRKMRRNHIRRKCWHTILHIRNGLAFYP